MRIFDKRLIRRLVGMTAITVLLVMIGTLFLSMAVLSQNREAVRQQKEYYKVLEQEYVKRMSEFLEEQGYANSGITMNRVIEEDGTLQYTVTIHHRRIEQLDDIQRGELLSKCQEIEFPEQDCSFCHKFLETSL